MSGRGGGGRERFRGGRFEERIHSSGGRGNAPPSRHLWVGNLSHNIEEADLTDQFLRFGELESVAFQPGRSYAFINFKIDEDAIASMKALQGFPLAGNPLRIEFAKAEKSTPSHDGDYFQHRDEQRTALRGSPFSQRESRHRHFSPDLDKSRMSDKNAEPSEVLWIGFPAQLKVDEVILRKAFSPFGEIEKITVFPGRSYAFVMFRSISSACRAKETLKGKLFGNPRVHICFARSESGISSERGSMNGPPSPHFKLNGCSGSSENFRPDKNFGTFAGDPSVRSPRLISDLDSRDADVYNFNKKSSLWSGGNNAYEPMRLGEVRVEPGFSQDIYERRMSPPRERKVYFHEFSQKGPVYEESWDLPEDDHYQPGAKKLKTGLFPPDQELPEYPFSDLVQEKRVFSRTHTDFSQPDAFNNNLDAGPFGYKQLPDQRTNLTLPHREKSDDWKTPYDSLQAGVSSLPPNPVDRRRFTPELEQPSFKEWKWEGIIAKGGTPVCRARCFPVGKVMDIMLPEFLDCTARTGLDMLAKHYYQASGSWVVFFVPGSDNDIGFYNEFMHYLEEKKRAAVAKLDDKTTLFLVPPSEFSEKVLKVPGKLSISGVLLRLEPPGYNQGPIHHANEIKDANFLSFNSDASYPNPSMASGPFPSRMSFPEMSQSGFSNLSGNMAMSAQPAPYPTSVHSMGNPPDSYSESRHEYPPRQINTSLRPNHSPHSVQNPVSGIRNISSHGPNSSFDLTEGHPSTMPKVVQETSSSRYTSGISGIPLSESRQMSHQEKPPGSLPHPIASLPPEQLAQLASTLLGQQRLAGSTPNVSIPENQRQIATGHLSDSQFSSLQGYALQNNLVTPDFPISQFGQVQQLQHQQPTTSVIDTVNPATQREVQSGQQGSQQLQTTGNQEADADPQKRLQATLQLAAALLQQIQRGKGT